MKAVVFHKVADIRLDEAPEPRIEGETHAIVRLTASAIFGTDVHFKRGAVPNMVLAPILGPEGVGIVVDIGKGVRN